MHVHCTCTYIKMYMLHVICMLCTPYHVHPMILQYIFSVHVYHVVYVHVHVRVYNVHGYVHVHVTLVRLYVHVHVQMYMYKCRCTCTCTLIVHMCIL